MKKQRQQHAKKKENPATRDALKTTITTTNTKEHRKTTQKAKKQTEWSAQHRTIVRKTKGRKTHQHKQTAPLTPLHNTTTTTHRAPTGRAPESGFHRVRHAKIHAHEELHAIHHQHRRHRTSNHTTIERHSRNQRERRRGQGEEEDEEANRGSTHRMKGVGGAESEENVLRAIAASSLRAGGGKEQEKGGARDEERHTMRTNAGNDAKGPGCEADTRKEGEVSARERRMEERGGERGRRDRSEIGT